MTTISTAIACPVDFQFMRPDEFAECINGVLAEGNLYERLWSFEPRYEAPRPEESEEPCSGLDSIARFWPDLTDEERATLVRLHSAHKEEEKAMMRNYYTSRGEAIPEWFL